MSRSTSHRVVVGGFLAASLLFSLTPTAHGEPTVSPYLHYSQSAMTGTVATDLSGNGLDGTIAGGASVAGGEGLRLDGVDDHIALPADVLAGLESVTVSTEVLVDPGQSGSYMLWALGNTNSSGVGNGYLFATANNVRAAIASGNWSTEQGVNSGAALARGVWKTLTYTLDDASDTAVLYLDGAEVARNTGVTLTPAQIGGGHTTANYIGRSVYTADRYLKGAVRDFRLYDTALSAADVASLVPSDDTRVQRDAAAIALGDLSAVTSNLTLPTAGPNGSTIAWTSSDGALVTGAGVVTRPAAGQPAATATLSATLTSGTSSTTRDFLVTVAPLPGTDAVAQADLDAVEIPGADDVRGNITLPTVGASGSTIAWSASPSGVVSTQAADGKAAGVVTRGATDQVVTLTATVPGTSAGREFTLTVKAAPQNLDDDYTAGYLWTHFAASGGYEKIFLGHSADGLHWNKLNDNQPVLANLGGDLGVRDPHLVRAPEGDKYWIIGTDLHAEGGGAGGSGWDQLNASQNIVVWESNDLVTWSDQRIVFAGFDQAGCVWAPEAIWNEETGEYYVYWSARDRSQNNTTDWALRVYLTKTRDFVNFTTPEVWLSLNEPGDGVTGPNIIDTTIAEENGVYYRFSTSDWHTVVDTATSLDGPWTTVISRGEAAAHGMRASMEGLTVYQLPDGRWAVMGDQSGYYAQVADTLAGLQFTQLTAGSGADQFSFDAKFRHGSVLRLSAAEQARLLAAYGDAPTEEPGQETPIARYTFDDGTLKDSVGTAHLSASGTATVATDAVKGSALKLDGSSNGFASFPVGMFDGRDTMTVSMDIRSERSSGNFFSFAFGQDSTDYYFLRVRGADVRSAITQTSWQNESAVTGTVEAGQWHRYDVVFDGDSMTVYADGFKLGTNEALETTVSDLGTGLQGFLGKSFYSADGYFQGWFDNIEIYNRALSAQEVLTRSGNTGALGEVTLSEAASLKIDPVVDTTSRTVTFPVVKGTDRSALTPQFITAAGVTATPASGTTVDLTGPVTVTLTSESGEPVEWTFTSVEVKSPVLPGLYADPNIAAFGDTYYIYATSDGYAGWGGKEFYVWKSKNLVDWTRSEQPFLTLDGANGNVPWATGNAWAPTIIERDGKYYFYFSGHNASVNRKTIGVAVADHPEGPFTAQPQAMILNNETVTSGQAIDPAAFHDPVSGKYYLLWGNGGPSNGPVIAELNDDMVSVKAGTFKRISGLTDFREGLFLNYRDGLYHLTWSIDDTGSQNYRVGYATSTSIDGPWAYHGVILEKDTSLGILGTGHSSILNVPGTDDWYIAYHRFGMPGGNGNNRETTIDKLTIGPDGLFQKVTPTLESVDPQEIVTAQPDPVAASVSGRCVAGKVYLAVTGTNLTDAPLDLQLVTAHGTKTHKGVAQSASTAFATRSVTVPAGEVTVRTTTPAGGTVEVTASYPALSCN